MNIYKGWIKITNGSFISNETLSVLVVADSITNATEKIDQKYNGKKYEITSLFKESDDIVLIK